MELRAALLVLAACHHPPPKTVETSSSAGDVMMFRDAVVVRDAVTVEIAGGTAHAKIALPIDVDVASVLVTPLDPAVTIDRIGATPPTEEIAYSTTLDVDVGAPRPGKYVLDVAYTTTTIGWQAAYTMTTDAARLHAQLRGAVSILNNSGIDLAQTRITIIDTELEAWRASRANTFVHGLFGGEVSPTTKGYALGTAMLPRGETRVELLADESPRAMKSVLVYDPIGTQLDHKDPMPLKEIEYGARATSRVTESFEITRPAGAPTNLPSGPIRLLARRADGGLVVLGESQLDAAGSAAVDTIAVGTAEGITGKRRQVELTDDEDNTRLVEEFEIEIANTRTVPVDIVVREHAYRGAAWSLGYSSEPPTQDGKRPSFTMKVRVPPRGTKRTSHTIVYTWKQQQ